MTGRGLSGVWEMLCALTLVLLTWMDTYISKIIEFVLKKCTYYNCYTSIKTKTKAASLLAWRALGARLGV